MKALLVGISAELGAIVAKLLGARGHDENAVRDGVLALEVVARDAPAASGRRGSPSRYECG